MEYLVDTKVDLIGLDLDTTYYHPYAVMIPLDCVLFEIKGKKK